MSTDTHDRKAVEERLWKEIDKAHFGMLGLVDIDPPQHFQPMSAFTDQAAGEIWFYARTDSDLVRDVERGDGAGKQAGGHDAMLIIQAKDREVQACIGGVLTTRHDRDVIDRYWSPMVAAWYPNGKDDPALILLRFKPADAQVWIADAGPVKFGWEIAKANATGKTPDLGGTAHLDLG
jgi:general stress protein 26